MITIHAVHPIVCKRQQKLTTEYSLVVGWMEGPGGARSLDLESALSLRVFLSSLLLWRLLSDPPWRGLGFSWAAWAISSSRAFLRFLECVCGWSVCGVWSGRVCMCSCRYTRASVKKMCWHRSERYFSVQALALSQEWCNARVISGCDKCQLLIIKVLHNVHRPHKQ